MASTNPTNRTYTEAEIELAFATAALLGNIKRAAKEVGMPQSTLTCWIKDDPTRYEAIRARLLPKIQERMAVQAEEAAMRQAALSDQIVDRLETQVGSLSAKDATTALKNVEVAKAVNIDKAQLLRGNPTQIVEQRNAGDILEGIAKRFPHLVDQPPVDSTAEEMTEAQLEQSVG